MAATPHPLTPPPPCVLLGRSVHFVGTSRVFTGWDQSPLLNPQEVASAVEPHLLLAEPPQVSKLHMAVPAAPAHPVWLGSMNGGVISSTHKGIIVMCFTCYLAVSRLGYYMLYNNGALTAIPLLPDESYYPPTLVPLGEYTAVAVADAGDDYILADIAGAPSSTAAGRPALPEAKIFAWPLNNKDSEWVQSSILQLPLPAHLCGPDYFFEIDMAFSLDDGRICWVDLLQGILLCDHLLAPQGPNLSFIPLPPGCCRNVHHKRRHVVMPIAHRSIACVSGVIKFVALDVGWGPNAPPPKEVMLTTWALSPDFKDWKEDSKPLSVGDIWESDSYKQMGLPPDLMPFSPLLSPTEDGVMYAVLNDIEEIPEQVDEFGFLVDDNLQRLEHKGSYMIRFDIVQNKVLSSTRIAESRDWRWTMPNIIAVDFSAYLQDHKRAEEASASTKGKKRKQME